MSQLERLKRTAETWRTVTVPAGIQKVFVYTGKERGLLFSLVMLGTCILGEWLGSMLSISYPLCFGNTGLFCSHTFLLPTPNPPPCLTHTESQLHIAYRLVGCASQGKLQHFRLWAEISSILENQKGPKWRQQNQQDTRILGRGRSRALQWGHVMPAETTAARSDPSCVVLPIEQWHQYTQLSSKLLRFTSVKSM